MYSFLYAGQDWSRSYEEELMSVSLKNFHDYKVNITVDVNKSYWMRHHASIAPT